MSNYEAKLNRLLLTKKDIEQALIDRGVDVPSNASFRDYVELIKTFDDGVLDEEVYINSLNDAKSINGDITEVSLDKYKSLDNLVTFEFKSGLRLNVTKIDNNTIHLVLTNIDIKDKNKTLYIYLAEDSALKIYDKLNYTGRTAPYSTIIKLSNIITDHSIDEFQLNIGINHLEHSNLGYINLTERPFDW